MRTLDILHGYCVFTSPTGPAVLRDEGAPCGDMLALPDPTPVSSYLINMSGPVPAVGTPVLVVGVHAHVAEVYRRSTEAGAYTVRVDVGRWGGL